MPILSKYLRRSLGLLVLWAVLGVVAAACGGEEGGPAATHTPTAVAPTPRPEPTPTPLPGPRGAPLTQTAIDTLAKLFADNPLAGGQVAPRRYRWINENAAIFLEFDQPDLAQAKALRWWGVALKGVFCAEAHPRQGFTSFQRLNAPSYAQGQGGNSGEPGYWHLFIATDSFEVQGRKIKPGVDYEFPATVAPSCGGRVPTPDFAAPGARKLTSAEIAELFVLFADNPFTGGQMPPRSYKWVNENIQVFLQFDRGDPAQATALRWIGLSGKGQYCRSNQPSPDFRHFHRVDAPTYSQGHGGAPQEVGYWFVWVAVDSFDLSARTVRPGVDPEFAPIPIEESC